MPVFFLHQRRQSGYLADMEGAEFADVSAAREEAIHAARELVAGMARSGVVDLTASFEIESETGEWTSVPFSEAVEIRR